MKKLWCIGVKSDIRVKGVKNRYSPRFFDQVGHQTMSAYIENKHFYEQSQQKLGTFLENKVLL